MANILEEVQRYVADKLNLDSQLSGMCTFLAENRKDIDYEIKKALGREGIVGLVMTPKAVYQGKYEDLFHAWQLDELEIDIVENPIVNRGKKDGYITGQDASMHLFEVLCPKDGPYEGQLNPVSYEEGEDGGLIVNRCILKTLVYGEEGPGPEPTPTLNMYFVKLLDEVPPLSVQPRDGWMWPTDNGFVVWQNGQVHELGVSFDQISSYVESAISAKADLSAIHGDYIEDADGNKVEADLNARRVIKHHAWYVTDTSPGGYAYSLQPLDSFLSAEYLPDDSSEGDHGFKIELNQNGENDYTGSLTDYLYFQGEWIVNESFDVELLNGALSATCDQYLIEYAPTAPTIINTTLATLDDLPTKTSDLTNDSGFITSSALPTKTSDLTNDSGFITSAQVPTPDKIEDLSANVIYANRNVQYIEEIANWTDADYPNNPLNWDAENNWWIANVSPSFYMKLQFNSGTWTLEIGENIGGEWVIDSGSVQDTQEATQLDFNVSGVAYVLTKGVQQIQTTGELALKSYVNGIVGNINTILDNINGEVI